MLIALLSPAKSLDENCPESENATICRFLLETRTLLKGLKKLKPADFMQLMGISEKLAVLNFERYQGFSMPENQENGRPAAFMFTGDVYQNLKAREWSPQELEHAQKSLRILSGLYGLLRPLDLMAPYRLEMGTKFQNPKGKNLYEFWGRKISDALQSDAREIGVTHIINLASNEYFAAVDKKALKLPIIQIDFKEMRAGNWRTIALNSKRARGMMADFLVREKLEKADELRDFQGGGYRFLADLSKENHWVFGREHV